jgi:hypothetical protein
MSVLRVVVIGAAVLVGLFSTSAMVSAQEPRAAQVTALPDAPEPQNAPAPVPQESEQGKQTKRILGVVPNFRSVSVNAHLPAQTPGEKFKGFTQDSFDYSSFIFVGILSGVSQLQGSTPEFHTGPPAYGRYYWHNFADQTDENLWVGFLLPVALKEDPRFYTLGSGGGGSQAGGVCVLAHTGDAYGFRWKQLQLQRSGGSRCGVWDLKPVLPEFEPELDEDRAALGAECGNRRRYVHLQRILAGY